MSLEDNFHNKYHNNCSLVAKFKVDPSHLEKVRQNILSQSVGDVLSCVNIFFPEFKKYTQKDILDNKHPLFYNDLSGNTFNLHINHYYIGGSILVRLIESITETDQRHLPSTNIYKGILYGLYNIKSLYNFFKYEKNPINIDKNYYYTKSSIVVKIKKISRLDQAYFSVFNDALAALDKETIKIGIPVPFNDNCCVNNVGIIIFEFNKNISIYDFSNLIKKKMNLVYTSNIYNLYGKKLSNIIGIDNYSGRQKLDIICSSFISDNKSIPGEFCLQPKGQIYETAYVSMYVRLLGDKNRAEVFTSVTTNCKYQKWKNVKYINSVINSI